MRRRWGLALLILFLASPLRAASYVIRLSANPPSILADGVSTSTIMAEVRDASGQPVPDGTIVRFTTTAGTITSEATTQGGVAKATLTSDRVPQFATVTAIVGDSQAQVEVEFTTTELGGRAARLIRLWGDYLAYSLDRRILLGTSNVRLKSRGFTICAQSLQLDVELEVVRAQGKVEISTSKARLQGDRLYFELRTLHGIMLRVRRGVEKLFFAGEGLKVYSTEEPIPQHAFEPVEVEEGTRTWIVAERVTIYPRERIQFARASIYVNEVHILSLPYYIVDLRFTTGYSQQQLSVNTTDGFVVDIPFYLHADLTSTTALRLRRAGSVGKSAIYATRRGWGIDLERQYTSLDGKSEGALTLQDLQKGPKGWTLAWHHEQEFSPYSRAFLYFSSPRLRGFYASADFYKQGREGDLTFQAFANRSPGLPTAYTLQLSLRQRTKFRGPLSRSLFATLGWSDYGFQKGGNLTLGANLYPRTYYRKGEWSFSPLAQLTHTLYTTGEGRTALRFSSTFSRLLGRRGQFSLSYSLDWQRGRHWKYSRQTLGLNLYYRAPARWFASLYLNYGLNDSSLYGYGSINHRLGRKWRLELQAYLQRYPFYSMTDYEVRVAYMIGSQELVLGWSSRTGHLWLELAANAF